jgi:hypothetical protein
MVLRQGHLREPYRRGRQLYVRGPEPIDFPSEEPPEERVSETKRHLEARTTLYLLLREAFAGMAIGSEQFLYWDAGDPRMCLSPDVFVKRGAPDEPFDTWKVWERGAPDLAVEIVSASDRRDADWAEKLARYQASGIGEVVRFDGDAAEPIRVWDRVDGELLERSPESTALRECVTLGLWWVVAPSAYGPTLRLARDSEGRDRLPTPGEDRSRLAEELREERKARSLAEHDRNLAEHALKLAEEKLRAESEARAAVESENERLRAELARLRRTD